ETVLRWHRTGFRLFWRRRSRSRKASPLPPQTIDLIRDMAARGRLWGAERIRGELLKLGIKVSKRTIQKYMRSVRGRTGGAGQRWADEIGSQHGCCDRRGRRWWVRHGTRAPLRAARTPWARAPRTAGPYEAATPRARRSARGGSSVELPDALLVRRSRAPAPA